jgi:hypothetical protein
MADRPTTNLSNTKKKVEKTKKKNLQIKTRRNKQTNEKKGNFWPQTNSLLGYIYKCVYYRKKRVVDLIVIHPPKHPHSDKWICLFVLLRS